MADNSARFREIDITCETHPAVKAVTRCLVCGTALCEECSISIDSHDLCPIHAALLPVEANIDDREQIQYPDLVTRALAFVTDGAILIAIGSFVLSIVMTLFRPSLSFNRTILVQLLLFGAVLAIYMTYFVRQGQTTGMALYNLRIIDAGGGAISTRQAFLRFVGYIICIASLCIGFLVAVGHPRGQGWHDRISGTIVVGPSLSILNKARAGIGLVIVLAVEAVYVLFSAMVR